MFRRIQRGRGRQGLFKRVQRGRGIGGVLSNIFRFNKKAVPIATKIAANPTVRKFGKEVLKSGARIGGEALLTNNLNSAVGTEFNNVKKRVGNALLDRGSEPPLKKKKKNRKKKSYGKHQSGMGKNSKKRQKKSSIHTKKYDFTSKKNKKRSSVINPITMRNIFGGKLEGGNQPTTIFDM